jgi:hypothetical protein
MQGAEPQAENGETAAEENLQCEKRHWKTELLTNALKDEILQDFIYWGKSRFVVFCP